MNPHTTQQPSPVATKLLRFADVQERVGMRRSFLFAAIKAGTFPKPIKHGRTILFVSSEIDAWIASRIADRDGKAPPERLLVGERELAEALGVSVSFLQKDRLRPDATIPFVKLGSAVRYDIVEAREALKKQRRGGGDSDGGTP